MTKQEAIAERDYIASVNPVSPGSPFNHDPKVFAKYCNMQANDARRVCRLAAMDMLQARDVAWPRFRSAVRNAGGHVEEGLFVPTQEALNKL